MVGILPGEAQLSSFSRRISTVHMRMARTSSEVVQGQGLLPTFVSCWPSKHGPWKQSCKGQAHQASTNRPCYAECAKTLCPASVQGSSGPNTREGRSMPSSGCLRELAKAKAPGAFGGRHLSLKDAQDVSLKRGGKCLSSGYVNNKQHLKWRCSRGHEWSASLNNVKDKGRWCPHCAVDARRLSLKVAKDVALKRDGRCLSTTYVNNKKHLKWICHEGHEWHASLDSVKNSNSWCPHCAGKAPLSLKVAQDIAVKRGGHCLSTSYLNYLEHLMWTCNKGHKWSASLHSIKNRGSWCPHCAVEARRLSLKVAQQVATAKGGKCLSTKYVSCWQRLQWRCNEGHEWSAPLHSIKHIGTWCPHCALGARRLSLKVAQDLALARQGRCLSTRYVNCMDHLHWSCSKSHVWSASLHSIKNKRSWCPHCVGKAPLSLKVAQDLASARGGTCISARYVNNKKCLRWRCGKGHEWSASLDSVKNQNSWCPHCAGKAPLSLSIAQDIALRRGGRCLATGYVNSRENLKWSCSKGHSWLASLSSIKNKDSWCPHCVGMAPLSLRVAQDLAVARDGRCLSAKYENCLRPLRWRCKKGHEWSASLNSIKNYGTWCPNCAGKAPLSLNVAQDLALAKEGRCLSTRYVNNRKHLMWSCRQGHKWSASLDSIKNRGTWCPHCAGGNSEREVRRILERKIFPGTSFRKCRPEFLRTHRGGRLELDGYCEELGVAFEFQGEQHYNPKSWWNRGWTRSFEDLVARDKMKLARCRELSAPHRCVCLCLSKTKTPQTVALQVTILCQQISKKKQHAPEHSFALTLRRSFVTIFWQKNLTKSQLAVLPFAVF